MLVKKLLFFGLFHDEYLKYFSVGGNKL